MVQAWSFWLAWAILITGVVAVFVWVVRVERAEAQDRDRWIEMRDVERRRRDAWFEEMTR